MINTMKTTIKLDLPFIQQGAGKNGRFLTGRMDNLSLYTALQPIFSLAHKRIVGHEALLRVQDPESNWITPALLFDTEKRGADLVHLDRLCRYIHIHNFLTTGDDLNWLFLNVSPKTIISGKKYGPFFKELLERFDFPAHRIVIEVVEQPIEDNDLLLETVNYYKQLGCLIAIDDFGAGHSNFDRIWTLKPDIVKLDRSLLIRASRQKDIRNLLPGIISLLHQTGALVLLEGIETRDQAMMAIESDADFVQGFYFGKPATHLSAPGAAAIDFNLLFDEYKQSSSREDHTFKKKIKTYTTFFSSAVENLKNGVSLEQAAKQLLKEPGVVRCYQMGVTGIQIGNTLVAACYRQLNDKRFKPLEDANSADWFRRHYLKRAIIHPEQLQVTRPYLSITGAHMCITLSMKFSSGSAESVLCCDLLSHKTDGVSLAGSGRG